MTSPSKKSKASKPTRPVGRGAAPNPAARVIRGRRINVTTPLGQWIVSQRMTVSEFALAVGIHERTISDYLAGRKKPSPTHTRVISDQTGLTEAQVIGESQWIPALSTRAAARTSSPINRRSIDVGQLAAKLDRHRSGYLTTHRL